MFKSISVRPEALAFLTSLLLLSIYNLPLWQHLFSIIPADAGGPGMGAAFGVMTAVFQHGWGAGLFGTEGVGAIEAWIPMFTLVILFGLSTDYHVFVVSRIREAVEDGMDTTSAVRHGITRTAGVVTSAAAIMVAVFAVFATLSMMDFKQMGVGLAAAIAIDATLIRIVVLPAVMVLLGERNWGRRRPPARPAEVVDPVYGQPVPIGH